MACIAIDFLFESIRQLRNGLLAKEPKARLS